MGMGSHSGIWCTAMRRVYRGHCREASRRTGRSGHCPCTKAFAALRLLARQLSACIGLYLPHFDTEGRRRLARLNAKPIAIRGGCLESGRDALAEGGEFGHSEPLRRPFVDRVLNVGRWRR